MKRKKNSCVIRLGITLLETEDVGKLLLDVFFFLNCKVKQDETKKKLIKRNLPHVSMLHSANQFPASVNI